MHRGVAALRRRLSGRDDGKAGDYGAEAITAIADEPVTAALACLPLASPLDWTEDQRWDSQAARLQLLLWHAGDAAQSVPEIGQWFDDTPASVTIHVGQRYRGPLRDRCLCARLLCVAADGIRNPDTAWSLYPWVIELASHPEPMIWIPAIRAIGRLARRFSTYQVWLRHGLEAPTHPRQRRAVTGLACAGNELLWLQQNIAPLLNDDDPWRTAALGPAVPFLIRDANRIWLRMKSKLLNHRHPAVVWSVVRGLRDYLRGQTQDAEIEGAQACIAEARTRAKQPRPKGDGFLWQAILRDTDDLDDIPPDPAFPDELLQRSVSDAIRAGASAMTTRISAIARSVETTFRGALASAKTAEHLDERNYAAASLESCVRAASLGLWQLVSQADSQRPARALDCDSMRQTMRTELAALLRQQDCDFVLRRAVTRGLGNLADAGDQAQRNQIAGFALDAIATSPWASAATAHQHKRFRKAISDLLWRVADSLRTTHSPAQRTRDGLIAWWLICLDIPLLETMIFDHADSDRVPAAIEDARLGFRALLENDAAGGFAKLDHALAALSADHSLLAQYTTRLACSIDAVSYCLDAKLDAQLPSILSQLVHAVVLGQYLRNNPGLALQETHDDAPTAVNDKSRAVVAEFEQWLETDTPQAHEELSRLAKSLCDRLGGGLQTPTLTCFSQLLDHWQSVRTQQRRAHKIGPYTKLRRLGSGGHGQIWLVKPMAPAAMSSKSRTPRPPSTKPSALASIKCSNARPSY